jgi:integrase
MEKQSPTNNGKKIRSVEEYLTMLTLAGRSEITIRNYRAVLSSYSKFMHVPLNDVHNHLTVPNLIAYAASRKGKSSYATHTMLSILQRYFTLNGVEFDELEANIMKKKNREDADDKPIETETLRRMMDIATPHAKAIISFLISTGCRAGETSMIRLSEVKDDVVTIRNEIAKGGHGGKVYLTSEAREYLDIWLKGRDQYIAEANEMTKRLLSAHTGQSTVSRKDIGKPVTRPVKDDRLFACSYSTMNKIFARLYNNIDGEQGKYGAMCTPHSCRKYFRTHAVKTMSIDLVEGIMRHTGYLNSSYVRMTDEDRRSQFHAGEPALYITRADHRIQTAAMDALKKDNQELRATLQRIEMKQQEKQQEMNEVDKMELRITPESLKKMIQEEIRKNQGKQ